MSDGFRKVVITQHEVQKCLDFAKEFTSSATKKSDLDFGHSELPRTPTDSFADTVTGKIGELAFQKICKNLNFNINVDFNVNVGRHNIDFGQDVSEIEVDGKLLTPLISIDVKTTKGNSHWLLLETHKHWASILILITTDISSDAESNLNAFNGDVNCEYIGYAYLSDFYDSRGVPWFYYKKGMRLLKPSFVDRLYEKAMESYSAITLKYQLARTYRELEIGYDINFGPEMKCPKQVGLPRKFLKNSENELNELLKFISTISVVKEQASNEVIQSILKLNYQISTAGKELKRK